MLLMELVKLDFQESLNLSKHSGEEIAELTNDDKNMINYLLQEIKNNHKFK